MSAVVIVVDNMLNIKIVVMRNTMNTLERIFKKKIELFKRENDLNKFVVEKYRITFSSVRYRKKMNIE